MCSGKTASLIRFALDSSPAQRVVIKHAADERILGGGAASPLQLRSRTGASLPVDTRVASLLSVPPRPHTLFVVDEAQFFPDLLRFWAALAPLPGAALLAAGLDRDFRRAPFGETLALAAAARALGDGGGLALPLFARCCHRGQPHGAACGAPAPFTQRLAAGGSGVVVVGGADFYRPACEAHHSAEPIEGAAWAEFS
jgi:thymidine kinase